MDELVSDLFDTQYFMPHGACMRWAKGLITVHIFSDALIAFSYYSIPFALWYFVKRRTDMAYRWIFVLFGAFIFSCGTTHLMEIWTLYNPVYHIEAGVKIGTALISAVTALLLWPLIPQALALPSPTQLQQANESMRTEVESRRKADAELRHLNEDLEARVRERTIELQHSNEDLRQFAYVASHDLQEPLRMVTTYIQLLERRYGEHLGDDGKELVGFAVKGAKRMKSLIDDLLSYSSVGAIDFTAQNASLEKALDDALEVLKESIASARAVVTRGELPMVNGSELQFSQVFQNLIGNAIKYRSEATPEIRISCREEDGNWQISVKDNGIGIDPRHSEKIFEIFQRLHGRDSHPGNGIGLSVCRRIIERHGGKIWVESEKGAGADFRFTLPKPVARKRQ